MGDQPTRAMRPGAVIAGLSRPVQAGVATSIGGYAWSGQGPIVRVEVSTDGGTGWRAAELAEPAGPAAWREFRIPWLPAGGTFELPARAADATGDTQGRTNVVNPLGYS